MSNRAGYVQVPAMPRFRLNRPLSSRLPLAIVRLLLTGSLLTPLARGQSSAPTRETAAAKSRRHVVLIVWDGLRPDSINDETTPTLAKLARDGVFFAHHHPVYPSMTEVNGTALATGCYPGHSGLTGNVEYRPAINPLKPVATENLATIRKGDDVTGGEYLRVPTLPETLHADGRRTVVAGTKGVAALFDRAARPAVSADDAYAAQSVVVYEGHTLPPDLAERSDPAFNLLPFPKEIHYPNVEQDAWTTNALLRWLWPLRPEEPPAFSVLWMSDPDFTQHQFGPDSRQARRALASVDADLSAVLQNIEAWPAMRGTTDVLVVSDHGFSTIGRKIDLAKLLTDAGFSAAREFASPPNPGDIVVDGLGGTVYLYVAGHDAGTIQRLVAFLQGSDFAGVIFTRDAQPGTFAMSAAHVDSPDAPDVAVAFRWNDEKNAAGFPGEVVSDGGRKPGQGTHATLSRYDMHNTLVAAGPDFKQGWRDELPSGNVDLAPTVAHLLGLPNPPKMDGRVLAEALTEPAANTPAPPRSERVESKLPGDEARWCQYLQTTSYDGVDYLDEGNGAGAATGGP